MSKDISKYSYQSLTLAYESHLTPSASFVCNTNLLRRSVNTLINVDNFEGEYAGKILSFLGQVVLGSIDAIEIAKEMYNHYFSIMMSDAMSSIAEGDNTVLITDTLSNIWTYSLSYSEFLYDVTSQLNGILDNMSCNMVDVVRPTNKDDIRVNHDKVYERVSRLETSMESFADAKYVDLISDYFTSVKSFVDYMDDNIDASGTLSDKYLDSDLETKSWYIDYKDKTMAYYDGMDLSYFVVRPPMDMPVLMGIAVSNKLTQLMMSGDLQAVEDYMNSVVQISREHGLLDPTAYFDSYASIMLGYAVACDFVAGELVDALGEDHVSKFPNEIRDALNLAQYANTLSMMFDGVSFIKDNLPGNADIYKVELTRTKDLSGVERHNVTLKYSLAEIDHDTGETYVFYHEDGFQIAEGTYGGVADNDAGLRHKKAIRDEERRQHQATANTAYTAISIALGVIPGVGIGVTVVSIGQVIVDGIALAKEINASDNGKETKDSAMAGKNKYGFTVVSPENGIPAFTPSPETANLVKAVNKSQTKEYSVNDLKDPIKRAQFDADYELMAQEGVKQYRDHNNIAGNDNQDTIDYRKNIFNYANPYGDPNDYDSNGMLTDTAIKARAYLGFTE